MKAVWICGLVAGAGLGVSAWALKPGDSRQDVINELGAPRGYIRIGDAETMYYDRGSVQMKTGKVVNAELNSAEQMRDQPAVAEQAHASTSQAHAPQQVQPVVYAQPSAPPQIVYVQQPPMPQVVYVTQPAPQQVVYLPQDQQPQVVYYSQPTPTMYLPQAVYTSPYNYGCYLPGYYAGGSVRYGHPSFYGGRGGYGGGSYGVRAGHGGGSYGGGRASGRSSYRR
jgi:uncharacterized membrane protein YgcG